MPEKNEQTDAQTGSQLRGTVENKAPKPAGLLPKNTQQLVILGVAVVMVLIMWLTGGAKHTVKPTTGMTSAMAVQAPDPAAVQDFKQTIQKEQAATRQPISPSDLARLQALGLADEVPPGGVLPPSEQGAPQPGEVIGGTTAPPPPDPVKEDKKKREYLSLFAPNVAFTYRSGPERQQMVGSEPNAFGNVTTPQEPSAPSPGAEFQQPGASLAPVPPPVLAAPQQEKPAVAPTPHPSADASTPGSFNSYAGKRYVVFEGTVFETLLINRLNGSLAGPVDCLVTTDIYSHDRQHLLIPAGTKVLGEAKKVESLGQQRLAVYFHRLIMPDGYSVDLDQFSGLDQIGETALRDKVNNHYVQIFGAALAVGVLGGIAEAGSGNVFTNSPLDQARADFGENLATASMQILDRFLNVLPTVTIREGHRVKIYLSGDLLVPDYADHTMQPDF